jgi:hypothetical protein
MDKSRKRLERAMQSLKARSCGRATFDVTLEDRIMTEFDGLQRRRRRIRTSLVTVLMLFVCGGGFTAAGGVEVVKQWFTRIEFVDPSRDPSRLRVMDAQGTDIGEIKVVGGGLAGDEDTAPSKEP